MKKIKLRAPATTANVGPGFDSLGCAFSVYNQYEFELMDEGLVIEGCPEEFCNEENLSYVSYKAAMEYMGLEVGGIKIKVTETNVPVSRGLGSSATMISAGVYAANALHGYKMTDTDLLKVANMIEGHPDNVAPALFGGFTASFLDGADPYTVKYNISDKLFFCCMYPDFEVSTHKARAVLPKEVKHEDAIFNVSRTAVLLKALENCDEELIKLSLSDRLHQPYRKELIDEYEDVKKIALDSGCCGFFISGAGPTLMAVSTDKDVKEKLDEKLKDLNHKWTSILLKPDFDGVKEI
ncbi:MAG: homoserine kinase [Clostridia bacterium]|nr:homoserine kinase [Clostridia bacterium]